MIDHLWFYLLIATAAVIDTLLFSFTTYMEWKRYRSHPKPPKPAGQQPFPSVSADPMTDRWVPVGSLITSVSSTLPSATTHWLDRI